MAALRPGKLVAIPGSRRRKTIETMSAVELGVVVDDLATPPTPTVPIEEVVQTVRSKLAALGAAAKEPQLRKDELDRAAIRKLRDELHEVVSTLEATLQR